MLLSEFKNYLTSSKNLDFVLPDGTTIPKHFHITEVGQISKRYIDCGGTIRNEQVVSMQLWASIDLWHRLEPSKLISIIDLSIDKLQIEDLPIEIEYQSDTIGKYGLTFKNDVFHLTKTYTVCLAEDACGIPSSEKIKDKIQTCCDPKGGCC